MGLDAPLVAAVTLRRQRAGDIVASDDDAIYQLQLAHVLLDGGYDGVATIGEALEGGDHGLGTLNRLNGELVIVDGEPWQVDFRGEAHLVDPTVTTPFVVVTHLEAPITRRLVDADRDELAATIESIVDDPRAVVAVRVEGEFRDVLVRSVPPQDPPYRSSAEVCATDEVRWNLAPFSGLFVGFRFPDLTGGDIIPGLHLHGLSGERSTGGHNYDLHIRDAVVTVGISHEIVVALPDRGMVDLLETPRPMREVQRVLLRRGPRTSDELTAVLDVSPTEIARRLEWLEDRGFVEEMGAGLAQLGGEPRWRVRLTATPRTHTGTRVSELLGDL